MIAGLVLTAIACGSLAFSPNLDRAEWPFAANRTQGRLPKSLADKELSSLPDINVGSAALREAGRKPVPPCDFTPLPLGQKAAKLPPLPPLRSPEPADSASHPALDGAPVGDFCPLPRTRHAGTTPTEPTGGPDLADQQPSASAGYRTVVRVVPVQRRRVVVASEPRWVLTQSVARTPHGQTVTRSTWVRMMQPVRREIVETTWVRRVERVESEHREPQPGTRPVMLRTYIVRRHAPSRQSGSGSSFLRLLSRLWTATP
jgi:hypothetical protein